jgi:hypothetical protein
MELGPSQQLFHLRCDCDGDADEVRRSSYESRSSMPNVKLRPMCCVRMVFCSLHAKYSFETFCSLINKAD